MEVFICTMSDNHELIFTTKPLFHFQRLIVYEKAKVHHSKIVLTIRANSIPHYMKDQWLRASLSIVLNIAEGYGRSGRREKFRFYNIARSSVFECVALTDMLLSMGCIPLSIGEELILFADELSRMLNTMCKNRLAA